VYDSYNNGTAAPWSQFGGTSAAAPQWSALIAIADQGRALSNLGTLDSATLLKDLYSFSSSDFHDITSGTSTRSPHYSAGTGYALVTGLGSPLADKVVADLVGATPPAAPTGLTATAISPNQINLSWNDVSGETGFKIERSPDGVNGWTQ